MSKEALEIHRDSLRKASGYFQSALPVTAKKYLTPDRITQIAITSISRSPQLLACTPPSILKAVMDIVQCGLEPGGPRGHAYIVPYGKEATAIIGYKGYIDMVMRSGLMRAPPIVNLVYEADTFSLDLGSGKPPKHTIDIRKSQTERGEILGGYCVAQFKDGGAHVEWMGIDDIRKVMNRSRAGPGPWKTDFEQMARKTVIRRAKNYWPLSSEMSRAAEIDTYADQGDKPPAHELYEAEFVSLVNHIPQDVEPSQDAVADAAAAIEGKR